MLKKRKKLPILISIPHASTFVPADLRRLMIFEDDFHIRKQSDLYTDEIFELPNVYTVKARISRLVVDVNRAPDDIEVEYKLYHDGVVVSVDEFGDQIYESPPAMDEIFARVEKYHDPFHAEIESLSEKVDFLIDGHSLWNIGPKTREDAGMERADIVLGNRDFTTCSRETTLKIAKFFEKKDLSVKVNDPYAGKYLIGYHCSRRGLPGIQIEVNRKLFMNEKNLKRKVRGIKRMRSIMKDLVVMLSEEIEKHREMGRKFK